MKNYLKMIKPLIKEFSIMLDLSSKGITNNHEIVDCNYKACEECICYGKRCSAETIENWLLSENETKTLEESALFNGSSKGSDE